MTPKSVLAQFSPVKISPLNKYYFDKSNITDKHDPKREKFWDTIFFWKTVFLHP